MRQSAEFSRNAAGAEPLVGDAAALCESSLRIFRGTRGSVAHPAGQPIHLERVGRDRVTGIELSDSSRDKPGRSEESERPPTRRSTAASLYAYSGKAAAATRTCAAEHLDPRIRRCCREALGNWLRKVRLPQADKRWSTSADYPAV